MSCNLSYTGVIEIDNILSAIEEAANGYHNTEQGSVDCDGKSYEELISEEAAKAATLIKSLQKNDTQVFNLSEAELEAFKLIHRIRNLQEYLDIDEETGAVEQNAFATLFSKLGINLIGEQDV